MTLATNELFSSSSRSAYPRIQPAEGPGAMRTGTFAANAAATLLPLGCPVAWNSSASVWVAYTQPSDAAVYTITAGATAASAGTFILTIDGIAVVLAYDVAAAAVQSEVNAVLLDAGKPYTIAAVATTGTDLGDNDAVVTVTFSENAGAPSVDLSPAGLTGTAHALAASDAGTQLNQTNEIRGFVYDKDGLQLDASNEVQGLVMLRGEVHRDDINTTAMRAALVGSPSEAELDTALKSQKVRDLGLTVVGLAGVS